MKEDRLPCSFSYQ